MQSTNKSLNFMENSNPTHGNIHMQLNKIPPQEVVIDVRNVIGQKLMERKTGGNRH